VVAGRRHRLAGVVAPERPHGHGGDQDDPRLARACALAGGATVTQAAHRCGWATASAFVDTFTAAMGQTPGAYRSAATSA
jgi:AraC-like DNA-binding protein